MPRSRAVAVVLAAAAALAACDDPLFYAKLDAPSVAIVQTLPAVPGAPPVDVPQATLAGVEFRIGDVVVSEVSDRSRLTLNAATLALRAPGAGTTFAGVRSAQLRVVGPPGSALAPQVVAAYDQALDPPAGTTLALRGSDVDLLPYLTAGVIRLDVSGSGVPPGPQGTSWVADLTLDLHLLGRVGWP